MELALSETGAIAKDIELEITESMASGDADHMRSTLGNITALGISIALDDFGTGYSSLRYLDKLPIQRLKIDKVFVKEILENPSGQYIAAMVTSLGRSLNLRLTAEGIENQQQEDILRSMGCC